MAILEFYLLCEKIGHFILEVIGSVNHYRASFVLASMFVLVFLVIFWFSFYDTIIPI